MASAWFLKRLGGFQIELAGLKIGFGTFRKEFGWVYFRISHLLVLPLTPKGEPKQQKNGVRFPIRGQG